MGDAQAGREVVKPSEISAQPGDGRSILEHSGWLDHLKHSATTLGHTAANLMHKGLEKGKEIAHDPKNQKLARDVTHEALQAGKEVGQEHVQRAQGVADAYKRGDVAGAVRNGLPLVGEALTPHSAAGKILIEKGAEIAEHHASPHVRTEIEKAKTQVEKAQGRKQTIPHLAIDGLTSEQTTRH